VGFDPVPELMPDGAHFDLTLHGAKGGLGFGQLDIRLPQLGGAVLAGPMRTQQIRAIAIHCSPPLLPVPFPFDALLRFVVAAVFEEPPHGAMSLFEVLQENVCVVSGLRESLPR
jgi:hypothetical protein